MYINVWIYSRRILQTKISMHLGVDWNLEI